LLHMGGSLLSLPKLAGLAAATNASPHPKVFSAVDGLETYSTRFFIEWNDAAGKFQSLPITPTEYAKIRGPYNRRNVYGAVLAYGPILAANKNTRPLFESLLQRALTGQAPLLHELGIDVDEIRYPITIRLEPERKTELKPELKLSFEVNHE
jgi:hypothetical protein